jgi:predicted phosphoribosyltransferase
MQLNSRAPIGPIEKLWDQARFEMKLVNPANKRKHTIIVVGSGLAGGSAALTASPHKAASTPRRIITATEIACSGCSTTR